MSQKNINYFFLEKIGIPTAMWQDTDFLPYLMLKSRLTATWTAGDWI